MFRIRVGMTLVSRRLGYLATVVDATSDRWVIQTGTYKPVHLSSIEVFNYFEPMI